MRYLLFILLFFSVSKIFAQTDSISPDCHLIGSQCVAICQNYKYLDAGVKCDDSSTNDVTITQEGDFITEGTKTVGVYKFRYKMVKKDGKVGYTEWRYIYVKDPSTFTCKTEAVAVSCNVSVQKFSEINAAVYVFPNPAQEEIFIQSTNFINTISIYNISGQKLQEININQKLDMPYKIDTKHFPAGIYIVQLKNASGIIYRKVEIRH